MSTYTQRSLFTKAVKAKVKPADEGNLIGTGAAPKGREWLRSFLHPGQLPPETPPVIVPSRRRSA